LLKNYYPRSTKKDFILLKSTNTDWPDTEVKLDEIEIIGQIKQVIKTVDI
jgi:SOS-response transcriptional repressor LexA